MKPPAPASMQSMTITNGMTDTLDFRVDFFDRKRVNTTFSAETFTQYEHYAVLWLCRGSGRFQVDFQHYDFENDKMIFLTPGQYFNVEKGDFEIIRYSFQQQFFCVKENNPETLCNGVLFNHVYAVASIEIGKKESSVFSELNKNILNSFSSPLAAERKKIKKLLKEFLSYSVQIWLDQSPFSPDMTEEETEHLFAFRRALETNFTSKKTMPEYAAIIGISEKKLQRLVKNRVGKKLSDLTAHRQLLEAKRELYFTGKPVKEIAYDIGFDEAAYFNRFFKKNTDLTPEQFREKHGVAHLDDTILELKELIDENFKKEHGVAFYAEKLFLTPRTLSDTVKKYFNKTVSNLIKMRLVLEAKQQLNFTEKTIKEIAWELGFEEATHFSHFFKTATGSPPESFRNYSKTIEKPSPVTLHKQLELSDWIKKN